MDSLAQELLDAIIEHIPPCETQSCSLVARRWRKPSQRRYFSNLVFSTEREVFLWRANIPQELNGIPSYVRNVEFRGIHSWAEPTLFGWVLRCFRRIRTLTIYETEAPPSEIDKIVARSEFGKEVTSLTFIVPFSATVPLMGLALSCPKLQNLELTQTDFEPPSSIPLDKTWQGGPLRSLRLFILDGEGIDLLASCGITSHKLDLHIADERIEDVIASSSETVRELVLRGLRLLELYGQGVILTNSSDTCAYVTPTNLPHMPPLPVLTTVEIEIHLGPLSDRVITLLSFLSAPALSSITFRYDESTLREDIDFYRFSRWTDMDKCLARLAAHAKKDGSLTVVLTPWRVEDLVEKCLPEFRKAGGELKVEFDARDQRG